MNSYEAKQEARRERFERLAAKSQAASTAAYNRSRQMASIIPLGQPILVGHYSEKRDRAYRARIGRAMDRSCELAAKAKYFAQRAAAVGDGGISSDDPDALVKLFKEAEKLQALQSFMVEANKIVRAFWKAGVCDASSGDLWARYVGKLQDLRPEISEEQAAKLMAPDFCGRRGFPGYRISNNSANIRRIQARIAQLKRRPSEEKSVDYAGGITYREDPSENRVMLLFPGKPADSVRKSLKCYGFKWSPTRGAWVRFLNDSGIACAKAVLKEIGVVQSEEAAEEAA